MIYNEILSLELSQPEKRLKVKVKNIGDKKWNRNTIYIKYDQNNKHLKAIEKGIVAPRGNIGLVPSEIEDYELKSKVLGKGGDRRFHAIIIDGVLHFPGFITEH
ncbi:MAG TPA: hypothetical protein VK211_16615 [Kamptonema sp.]|nr:hypothetical protein [Kamptonema sp.]